MVADDAPNWTFAEGAALPGGFRAWRRLATGPRCETWLVWSPRLWGPAVLKLPRPHLVNDPRTVRELAREVAALRDDPHPALPRLYADGLTEDLPYVALEYVDGPALTAGAAHDVAMLGIQLLAALRTLHQHGMAHVDVKPENVVLRDGRPVLVGFSSARPLGTPQPQGRPLGTPGYAAPELRRCEPISPAMDVYALGVTLREVAGNPDGELGDVLDLLCAADPDRRPCAESALELLETVLAGDHNPWPQWVWERERAGTGAAI